MPAERRRHGRLWHALGGVLAAACMLPAHAAPPALAELESRAAAGDALAARALGSVYYAGLGVAVDPARAAAWWQQAAAAGDATAAYNAGLLLLASAPRTARSLLEQAAASGDVLAAFALGTSLARAGDAGAVAWLERAAAADYAPAQYNLARYYAGATPPDVARARHWYAAAASRFGPAAAALAALPEAAPGVPPVAAPTGRLHDGSWVLAQDADHYTLQVATGHDPAMLRELLARHAGERDAAVFEHRPGAANPYTALVGVFASAAAAAAALAELPAPLRANAPWVRAFGPLQRDLDAAAPVPP